MLPGVEVADPARQKMVEQLAQTNSSNLVLDCTPDHHATTSSVRDARWIERDPNADEEPDRRLLAERYRIEGPLDAGSDSKPYTPGSWAVPKTKEAEKSSANHSPGLALHTPTPPSRSAHDPADSDILGYQLGSRSANSTAAYLHTAAWDSQEVCPLALRLGVDPLGCFRQCSP